MVCYWNWILVFFGYSFVSLFFDFFDGIGYCYFEFLVFFFWNFFNLGDWLEVDFFDDIEVVEVEVDYCIEFVVVNVFDCGGYEDYIWIICFFYVFEDEWDFLVVFLVGLRGYFVVVEVEGVGFGFFYFFN